MQFSFVWNDEKITAELDVGEGTSCSDNWHERSGTVKGRLSKPLMEILRLWVEVALKILVKDGEKDVSEFLRVWDSAIAKKIILP